MAPGSNDWEQYYPKSFTSTPMVTGGGIITSSVTTTTGDALVSTTDQTLQTSTSPPTNGGGGQLTPTGSVSKPIRRRSRVSKKTPITLLNANANNFRALVQQFTGCAASTAPISFGNQKGPINLSFGVSSASSAAVMPPFGSNPSYPYNNNNNNQQNQLQRIAQQRPPLLQLQENHVQMHQEEVQQQQQQRMYPFENNNINGSDHHVFHYSSNSSSSGYNPMQAGMEIGDEFEVMDQEDISLHELLD